MSISKPLYLTRDEAIKWVKSHYRPGVSHHVRGGAFLYTELPNEEMEGARGYEMTNLIDVSQKAALKYISDMVSPVFAERGVKLRITYSENEAGEYDGGCIFIG